eukprot:TRINITY_DN5428_c0_g1_i1.p1 TRINITY_DN5428_c0_g1~~TRINITY_DN5428_c0_g1_i1.p1  ORF type:complete len:494 (+),score=158.87 TRINITY_DN5428_c0_g1_i1:99-1580(+)
MPRPVRHSLGPYSAWSSSWAEADQSLSSSEALEAAGELCNAQSRAAFLSGPSHTLPPPRKPLPLDKARVRLEPRPSSAAAPLRGRLRCAAKQPPAAVSRRRAEGGDGVSAAAIADDIVAGAPLRRIHPPPAAGTGFGYGRALLGAGGMGQSGGRLYTLDGTEQVAVDAGVSVAPARIRPSESKRLANRLRYASDSLGICESATRSRLQALAGDALHMRRELAAEAVQRVWRVSESRSQARRVAAVLAASVRLTFGLVGAVGAALAARRLRGRAVILVCARAARSARIAWRRWVRKSTAAAAAIQRTWRGSRGRRRARRARKERAALALASGSAAAHRRLRFAMLRRSAAASAARRRRRAAQAARVGVMADDSTRRVQRSGWRRLREHCSVRAACRAERRRVQRQLEAARNAAAASTIQRVARGGVSRVRSGVQRVGRALGYAATRIQCAQRRRIAHSRVRGRRSSRAAELEAAGHCSNLAAVVVAGAGAVTVR